MEKDTVGVLVCCSYILSFKPQLSFPLLRFSNHHLKRILKSFRCGFKQVKTNVTLFVSKNLRHISNIPVWISYAWVNAFETFWDISRHFETFWDILRHFETFLDILRQFETLRDILRQFKTLRDILREFETSWDIFRQFQTFKDILSQFVKF